MISYLDKVLYLYPNIQDVVYWFSQFNGEPWKDPYDGLIWNNTKIPKPTKSELDAVTDEQALTAKTEIIQQQVVNSAKQDLNMVANYTNYISNNTQISFDDYIQLVQQQQQNL